MTVPRHPADRPAADRPAADRHPVVPHRATPDQAARGGPEPRPADPHLALERFEVENVGERVAVRAAVPRIERRFWSSLHRRRRLPDAPPPWPERFAALTGGAVPTAWATSDDAAGLHRAVLDLRAAGFIADLRLGGAGDLRATACVPGTIADRIDLLALAADWRGWLIGAAALDAGREQGILAALGGFQARMPAFADWSGSLEALATGALTPIDPASGDAVHRAIVAGVLGGEDPAVRAAQLLAAITGDARFWVAPGGEG